jgi:hypothetical protein
VRPDSAMGDLCDVNERGDVIEAWRDVIKGVACHRQKPKCDLGTSGRTPFGAYVRQIATDWPSVRVKRLLPSPGPLS